MVCFVNYEYMDDQPAPNHFLIKVMARSVFVVYIEDNDQGRDVWPV
jgi:hypothetical protein